MLRAEGIQISWECGGGVTSYIWHSMYVRAEWPPFFSAARYMIGPPFFNKKYMNDPDFSGFQCEKSHFSDILVYAHIFSLLVFNELTAIFV